MRGKGAVSKFLEAIGRLSAIQTNLPDPKMTFEKCLKIVRLLVAYIEIETSLSNAGLKNIPNSDAIVVQGANPLTIGFLPSGIEQFTHDPPKGIVFVGIILASFQRLHARHAAKNQDASIRR